MNEEAFQRGVRDARGDIAAGTPKLYWGTRGNWGEKFTELMRQRFGISVIQLSCLTTDVKMDHERGYNDTIVRFIDSQYGEGSFQQARDEIERYRHERYQASLDGNA